jgi:hypothetical protein
MKNKAGIFFLNQIWQETLAKGQFPPRENSLKSETVDISFKPSYENINYRLKFSELSISFPPKKEIDSNEDDGFDDYIERAHAADMIILTVEAIEAGGNDLALSIILQALHEHKIELPIILVITQWDRVEQGGTDIDEFVKSRMPSTYKWLKYGYFPETRIARFSVGKVSPEPYEDPSGELLVADKISSLNTEDSGKIFHWIFEYLKKKSAVGDEEGALRQELRENLSRLSKEPENIDILRETRGIYLELGEEAEAEEVEKKLNRLIEKKEYKSNLGKRIYLRQMEVQGLDFFGKFRWIFQPGMNVLLGRNGYGKSHLLRFLATLLQKDELKSSEFFEHSKADPFARLTVEREESQEIISRNQLVFEESIGRVPLLAIPDMRSLDQSRTVVSYSGDGKEMDLSQQWCYHFLYQKPVEGLIQDFLYQLCITYLDRGKTGKIGAIVNFRPSMTGAAAII